MNLAVDSDTVIDTNISGSDKRKRDVLSSSSSAGSPAQIDKKIKQGFSTSSEEELAESELSDEHTEMGDKDKKGAEEPKGSDALFKSLDDKLTSSFSLMKTELLSEIKSELKILVQESVAQVEGKVHDLQKENDQFKEDLAKVKAEVQENKQACDRLQHVAFNAAAHAVRNEQYSRKSTIRVFGVKQEDKENTTTLVLEIIKEKLKVELRPQDIDASHRVGKQQEDKPRGIIVRFVRRIHKEQVIGARRLLKGSGITVTEDLCVPMMQLYNRVRNSERVKNCWTWRGVVFAEDHQGKVHKITFGQPLPF